MLAFHRTWGWAVVVLNIAAGVAGLWTVRRRGHAGRAVWASIVAGQLALAIQVTAGVVLRRTMPPPGRHVFYGFMLLFVAVLSWTFRGSSQRRNLAIASSVALFVGVVAVRTAFTAR